jgi:DNA-binding FrmR family transcriptional regulator
MRADAAMLREEAQAPTQFREVIARIDAVRFALQTTLAMTPPDHLDELLREAEDHLEAASASLEVVYDDLVAFLKAKAVA